MAGRALLLYPDGARLIEAQDIAGLECDFGLRVANLFAPQLDAPMLDQPAHFSAGCR
jgi:hypothetical protein